jgi:hypothetical protein
MTAETFPTANDLRFLTPEERLARPEVARYRVMVFEPKGGIYPLGTWHVPNGWTKLDESSARAVCERNTGAKLRPTLDAGAPRQIANTPAKVRDEHVVHRNDLMHYNQLSAIRKFQRGQKRPRQCRGDRRVGGQWRA